MLEDEVWAEGGLDGLFCLDNPIRIWKRNKVVMLPGGREDLDV